MKEQDVRIGMKVVPHDKTAGQKGLKKSTIWEVAKEDSLNYLYVRGKEDGVFILSNEENYGIGELFNPCDFEPYIDTQEAADALNRAINNLTETLTKTLQPLIDALSRPEVVKELEAQAKDECPDTLEGADRAMWYNNKKEREQEKQREAVVKAVVKAYKEFRVSGTPYSSFTIFEAGYHAGMKRGDK